MTETKPCAKCNQNRPIADFEGRASCPRCRANGLIWYRANRDPERKKAYDRARYSADKTHRIEANKAWRTANPAFLKQHRNRASRRRARVRESAVEIFTAAELVLFWESRGIDPERCVYCDGPYQHNEHVIPIARGGPHTRTNLVPSCQPCNDSKGILMLSEWRNGEHEPRVTQLLLAEPTTEGVD
jgi:5-methylcytosine-specific restriction endonuclease McrA